MEKELVLNHHRKELTQQLIKKAKLKAIAKRLGVGSIQLELLTILPAQTKKYSDKANEMNEWNEWMKWIK